MNKTSQRNQFSTFSFYPNFVSLNAGHSPADLIDTGLPAEDLRQRVNSGNCGSDTSSGSRYFSDGGNGTNKYDPADDPRQYYSLYPNPSNGQIILQQAVLDTQPVQITVYNTLGIKAMESSLQFGFYTQNVVLKNLTKGLYLMRLTNSKQHSFNLSFIID